MSGPSVPILTIGDGKTGQLPREHRNSQPSPLRPFFKKLYLLLLDIRVFSDPLLSYIFVIKGHIEDIEFDMTLGYIVSSLHLFFDIITSILYTCFNLHDDLQKDTIVWSPLLNKYLAPISLVLVILLYIPSKTSVILALALIFLRFLSSLSRMHEWYRSSRTSETSYAWFMMFLVFYAAFSQFLGAFWYTHAIFKEVHCLKSANRIPNDESNYQRLFHSCSSNTTNYDFGIYRDAHQSGILEMTGSPLKILYCFRWALQNLSSFGQSLETGTNVQENIFLITIMFTSVFLFSFTVGKVQIFLQSTIKREEKIDKKLQEIEQWLPFQKLTENLQAEVKNYYKKVWSETQGHNKKNMFHNLPKDLKQKMISELCIDLLKKVEEFRRWNELNEASLADLCECVKLISYDEDTYVIRKGDPIHKMISLLQGMLWIYTPTDTPAPGSPSTDPNNPRNDILKEGEFCGEKLVTWFQADPYTSSLPVSDINIQAVTNVEAFVLRAYDLKNIFIKRHETQTATQAANTSSPAQSQP